MSLLSQLGAIFRDPPPSLVFEFSSDGIAWANGAETGFEPGADATSLIRRFSQPGGKKRRPAALLLPDQEARVTVLDFDSFSDEPTEQLSLVRFRLKKSVPFDIDSASVGYYVQPGKNAKGKIEVVAAVVSLDTLARYEVMFRNAGLHAGDVTVSALKLLELYKSDDVAIIAKLAGHTLTTMVVGQGKLKLYRCLELEDTSASSINTVLFPTLAYAEDELGAPVRKLIACGFEPQGLPCPVETLRSKSRTAAPHEAGLLGYVEGGSN